MWLPLEHPAAWDSPASRRAICKPGDEIVISIEGIGELRNPVIAEA